MAIDKRSIEIDGRAHPKVRTRPSTVFDSGRNKTTLEITDISGRDWRLAWSPTDRYAHLVRGEGTTGTVEAGAQEFATERAARQFAAANSLNLPTASKLPPPPETPSDADELPPSEPA